MEHNYLFFCCSYNIESMALAGEGEGMFSFITYSCIIILIFQRQCTKMEVHMVMLFDYYVVVVLVCFSW